MYLNIMINICNACQKSLHRAEKKKHKETKEKIMRGNSNVQNPLWGPLLWGLVKLWELLWIEYPRPFGTVNMLLSPGADWRWPII